ncbi:hypothetical protein VNO78_17235 [Psophocarpus tetragonolobus]|uniref:Uncharacterized protein n=1 Tax=Psophocarpus tetragonolobus TaxID=3891 RepID=A0AAN9SN86_PSOTE
MKADKGWQLVGKSRRLKGRGWKGGSRFQGKASSKEKPPPLSKAVRGASRQRKSYAATKQGGLNSYADVVKENKGSNGGAPVETQSSVQLSSLNFSNDEAELEAVDRRWEAIELGLGMEDVRVASDQSTKGHVKEDEAFTFSHACEDGKRVSAASSSGHGKGGRKHVAVWKEVRRHSVDGSVTGLLGLTDIIFKSSSPHMPYPTQKVLVSQTAGPEDCLSEGHEVKKVALAGMWKALQNIRVVGTQTDEWYKEEISRMERRDTTDKEGRHGGLFGHV